MRGKTNPFSKLLARVPDGFSTAPSQQIPYAVCRAQWGSLLQARKKQHISAARLLLFLRQLERQLVDLASVALPLQPNQFLVAFGEVVRKADANPDQRARFTFKDCRRGLKAKWGRHVPVTVQTCYRIHQWFEGTGIPGIESDKPDPPTIVLALKYFAQHRNAISADRKVGERGEAVWLSLAKRTASIASGSPDNVRDRLGLFRNRVPRHAVVAVLAKSVRHLPRESSEVHLRAPTAWDARGYERFRHWPVGRASIDARAGRTYDLNNRRRARTVAHGLPELIHTPHPLKDCHAILCHGRYATDAEDTLSSHQAFAGDVAGQGSLIDLVRLVIAHA